jgi:hypothetical protein
MVRTVMYLSKPECYFESVVRIMKSELSGKGIVYVTTNKPYSHLVNLLTKDGVDVGGIFFIDCISRQILPCVEESDNCIFIESPHQITSIGIAVSKAIEHLHGEKALFLDSLSTLLLYNEEKIVGQFSNFMINKMILSDVSSVIMTLSSDMDKSVIKQIMSFVDEVINYDRCIDTGT